MTSRLAVIRKGPNVKSISTLKRPIETRRRSSNGKQRRPTERPIRELIKAAGALLNGFSSPTFVPGNTVPTCALLIGRPPASLRASLRGRRCGHVSDRDEYVKSRRINTFSLVKCVRFPPKKKKEQVPPHQTRPSRTALQFLFSFRFASPRARGLFFELRPEFRLSFCSPLFILSLSLSLFYSLSGWFAPPPRWIGRFEPKKKRSNQRISTSFSRFFRLHRSLEWNTEPSSPLHCPSPHRKKNSNRNQVGHQ